MLADDMLLKTHLRVKNLVALITEDVLLLVMGEKSIESLELFLAWNAVDHVDFLIVFLEVDFIHENYITLLAHSDMF